LRGKYNLLRGRRTVNGGPVLLAITNPLPVATDHGSHKPRSRNKFGMTVLSNYEYVTSRHSELVSASRRVLRIRHIQSFWTCFRISMLSCWMSVTSLLHCPLERGLLSSSCNLHLGTCNRSFLRTENCSVTDQSVLHFSTTNPLPTTTVHRKPRSRNKFGMTVLSNYEYVTSRHSELVSTSKRLSRKRHIASFWTCFNILSFLNGIPDQVRDDSVR